MQTPNAGDWNSKDHQIARRIDDTRTSQDCVLIHTLGPSRHLVCLTDAGGDDGDDKGYRVENVVPEAQPDGPPDTRVPRTLGNQKSLIEEQE